MMTRLLPRQTSQFAVALVLCFALGLGLSIWFSGLGVSQSWISLELGREELSLESLPGTFLQVWFNTLRFPLFCFLCGFLNRGVLWNLGALGCRGFFLGYAVCTLLATYGGHGLLLALVLLLFHGILLLPLLFYTAMFSMNRCIQLRRRRSLHRLQPQDLALGVLILLASLLCTVLELSITPLFLSRLAMLL